MSAVNEIVLKNIMVASTTDSTLSRLWIQKHSEGKVISQRGLCWILEDGMRDEKIYGRTCIPKGRFRVKPTRNSKFYTQYAADQNLKLKYILWITEVPEFELIRMHAGIDVDDTLGCQLTGLSSNQDKNGNFTVGRSREALKRVHAQLDPYFDEKKMDFTVPVWIENIRTPLIELV